MLTLQSMLFSTVISMLTLQSMLLQYSRIDVGSTLNAISVQYVDSALDASSVQSYRCWLYIKCYFSTVMSMLTLL